MLPEAMLLGRRTEGNSICRGARNPISDYPELIEHSLRIHMISKISFEDVQEQLMSWSRDQLLRKGRGREAYEAVVLGQKNSDTSVYLANRQGD